MALCHWFLEVGMRLVFGLSILYTSVLGHISLYMLLQYIQNPSMCI